MTEQAIKAAQNVLHNVLMADMNPEKSGRHVSTKRLTEMMIEAYINNMGDVSTRKDEKAFEEAQSTSPSKIRKYKNMSAFPNYKDIIDFVALAITKTETKHQDHTFLPDAKKLAQKALAAFFEVIPECEDPDSAAYCYEKIEAMRSKINEERNG